MLKKGRRAQTVGECGIFMPEDCTHTSREQERANKYKRRLPLHGCCRRRHRRPRTIYKSVQRTISRRWIQCCQVSFLFLIVYKYKIVLEFRKQNLGGFFIITGIF